MDESKIASVKDLRGGAAVELVDDAMRQVIENIIDPNTIADATRKITLTLTIKPDDNRDRAAVDIGVSVKLAPHESERTKLFFGKENGEIVAEEVDSNQGKLFDGTGDGAKTKPGGKVRHINERK